MAPKVIKWDGSHIPEELRQLPPGQYAIEPLDDIATLTDREESGLRAALDQLDAGQGVSLAEVVRSIKEQSSQR